MNPWRSWNPRIASEPGHQRYFRVVDEDASSACLSSIGGADRAVWKAHGSLAANQTGITAAHRPGTGPSRIPGERDMKLPAQGLGPRTV